MHFILFAPNPNKQPAELFCYLPVGGILPFYTTTYTSPTLPIHYYNPAPTIKPLLLTKKDTYTYLTIQIEHTKKPSFP